MKPLTPSHLLKFRSVKKGDEEKKKIPIWKIASISFVIFYCSHFMNSILNAVMAILQTFLFYPPLHSVHSGEYHALKYMDVYL